MLFTLFAKLTGKTTEKLTENTIPFYEFISEEGINNGSFVMTIQRDVHARITFNPNPDGAICDGNPVFIMGTPTEFPLTIDGFKPSDLGQCCRKRFRSYSNFQD